MGSVSSSQAVLIADASLQSAALLAFVIGLIYLKATETVNGVRKYVWGSRTYLAKAPAISWVVIALAVAVACTWPTAFGLGTYVRDYAPTGLCNKQGKVTCPIVTIYVLYEVGTAVSHMFIFILLSAYLVSVSAGWAWGCFAMEAAACITAYCLAASLPLEAPRLAMLIIGAIFALIATAFLIATTRLTTGGAWFSKALWVLMVLCFYFSLALSAEIPELPSSSVVDLQWVNLLFYMISDVLKIILLYFVMTRCRRPRFDPSKDTMLTATPSDMSPTPTSSSGPTAPRGQIPIQPFDASPQYKIPKGFALVPTTQVVPDQPHQRYAATETPQQQLARGRPTETPQQRKFYVTPGVAKKPDATKLGESKLDKKTQADMSIHIDTDM